MEERLVKVSEQELRIDFALNFKCRSNLRLTSLCATATVAFKVQTSSPHKFMVNPPAGLIPPLSHVTLQVILKPQAQLPSTYPRSPSDRFLIKTAHFFQDPTHPQESINSWFASRPSKQDLKLKVAFVGPLLLRDAVARGDTDAVKGIIKRQPAILGDLLPCDAEPLLRVATGLPDPDNMVNLLLEAGLRISTQTQVESDPSSNSKAELKWASKRGDESHSTACFDRTEDIASLSKGKGVGYLDKKGRAALHLAASKGDIECVRALLDSGVDKDSKSKDGRTALHRAVENGDRRMVEILVKTGADPTITDNHGRSAINVALDKGCGEMVEILEQKEAVLMAARQGDMKHLESLVKKGARLKCCDQYGLTALHAAAIKGHTDVALMLVECGLDLECEDNEGHVALHMAVEGGHSETVQVLLNMGVNVDAKNKKGATPLYMAGVYGYRDISELLIKKGALSSFHIS